MIDISIIIVTYNSKDDIKNCIESIIKNTLEINYEIIVVDNSSTDGTTEIVNNIIDLNNNIKLIKSPNLGFNSANNRGIKIANGEFIALLNPDTILLNDAFSIILKEMKNDKNVGACGGALFTKDLNLNMSLGSFPSLYDTLIRTTKIRKDKFYLPDLSKEKIEVDLPCGADFVFRKELINEVGYMDERYFLYFDETDFALAIKNKGYKNYIFPKARIIHLQGTSTDKVSEFSRKVFLESNIKYLKKNVNKVEAILMTMVKIMEHYIKFTIIYMFRNKYIKKFNTYTSELNYYKTVLKNIL
ncbi:glycosyltransferase family 2 protein [Clostridium intestinale]|uniref:glycosyltransferase family 2 protein n=1 Tax=Clostridium intestinale TaxID=36845 RepID=UPI002DD6A809|nr:glycosyltransferase family 2 protein [Clostridium intestinale]WRY49807.1 glycosyltransferase family 2 protein [Clostridium intestinale]